MPGSICIMSDRREAERGKESEATLTLRTTGKERQDANLRRIYRSAEILFFVLFRLLLLLLFTPSEPWRLYQGDGVAGKRPSKQTGGNGRHPSQAACISEDWSVEELETLNAALRLQKYIDHTDY